MHINFDFLLWCVYPYLMLGSFVFGTIIRFTFFKAGVTAKSSEMLEKKRLMIGSILFHLGIIMAFFGHIAGMFIPMSWTDALGITDHMYHIGALVLGSIAGFMALAGMLILSYRRFSNKRIFKTSAPADLIVNVAFLILIILGLYASLVEGPSTPGFNYRLNISVWARQLFTFSPDYHLMLQVPLIFRTHVFLGLLMFGFFPYTRLVHAFTMPIAYFKRSPIVYRKNRVRY